MCRPRMLEFLNPKLWPVLCASPGASETLGLKDLTVLWNSSGSQALHFFFPDTLWSFYPSSGSAVHPLSLPLFFSPSSSHPSCSQTVHVILLQLSSSCLASFTAQPASDSAVTPATLLPFPPLLFLLLSLTRKRKDHWRKSFY